MISWLLDTLARLTRDHGLGNTYTVYLSATWFRQLLLEHEHDRRNLYYTGSHQVTFCLHCAAGRVPVVPLDHLDTVRIDVCRMR